MSIMDTDCLLTVRHYAERIGVVKETVMQRIRKGKVSAVRIDGRLFVINDLKKEKEEKKNED